MWAVGVIAYILVCQEPPLKYGGTQGNKVGKAAIEDFRDQMKAFQDYREDGNYSNTAAGEMWENKLFVNKEDPIKKFISKLLKKDPKDRLTAADAL